MHDGAAFLIGTDMRHKVEIDGGVETCFPLIIPGAYFEKLSQLGLLGEW
jgi:hypothetical protein